MTTSTQQKNIILRQVFENNAHGDLNSAPDSPPNSSSRKLGQFQDRKTSRYSKRSFFILILCLLGLLVSVIHPHKVHVEYKMLHAEAPTATAQLMTSAASEKLAQLVESQTEPVSNASPSEALTSKVLEENAQQETAIYRFDATLPSSEDYMVLWDEPHVPIVDLFGLRVRTIVIDPGHGGKDPGAIGQKGIREKDITLDLARRLRDRLEQHDKYHILLTRDEDITMSLRERVEFANTKKADLLISLHINALPVEQPTIIETYYFGPQSDAKALHLAELENQGSDYSMAGFRGVIEKIGDSFKHRESKMLATMIQRKLYRNIKQRNKKITSWGIKTAPFILLLGANMPSVLAEVTTLSNKHEEQRLASKDYRSEISKYLEEGIVEYLNTTPHRLIPNTGAKPNANRHTEEVSS